MSHVFLIGFMGSGKSTIGRLLAEKLGSPFIDLDELVVERSGKAISQIFADDGEQVFRKMESDELLALEGAPSAVVACGGGVITAGENRKTLKRLGLVIYLQVTLDEALLRIGDTSSRPLLSAEGMETARTLLQSREAIYRDVADVSIDTVGKTPDDIVMQVVSTLDGAGNEHV